MVLRWTDSLDRKLLRLYLFTTLPIGEIHQSLLREGFKPCPRSVQIRLGRLLQKDPRRLRPNASDSKNTLNKLRGRRLSRSHRQRNDQRERSEQQVGGGLNGQQTLRLQRSQSKQAASTSGPLTIFDPTIFDPASPSRLTDPNSLEQLSPQHPRLTLCSDDLAVSPEDAPSNFVRQYLALESDELGTTEPELDNIALSPRISAICKETTEILDATEATGQSPSIGDAANAYACEHTSSQRTMISVDSCRPPYSEYEEAMSILTEGQSPLTLSQLARVSRSPSSSDCGHIHMPLGDSVPQDREDLQYVWEGLSNHTSSTSSVLGSSYTESSTISGTDGALRDSIPLRISVKPLSSGLKCLNKVISPQRFESILPGSPPHSDEKSHVDGNVFRRSSSRRCKNRRVLDEIFELAISSSATLVEQSREELKRAAKQPADCFGRTPLHFAAAAGPNLNILLELVRHAKDVNAVDTAGQTFMHVLNPVTLLHDPADLPSLVARLLKLGFSFELCDDLGRNFLHIISRQNISDKVLSNVLRQILQLSEGEESNLLRIRGTRRYLASVRDVLGRNPVSHLSGWIKAARSSGKVHRAISLAGIIQSYFDETFQETQLSLESSHGRASQDGAKSSTPSDMDAVLAPVTFSGSVQADNNVLREMALTLDSDPDREDPCGRNRLHCLAQLCFPLESLASNQKNDRRLEIVQAQIRKGVDVNSYDRSGNTPLMDFIRFSNDGQTDEIIGNIVEALLEAGASVHRRNAAGETALHLAVTRGRLCATQLLLKHHAKPNARSYTGESVLAVARDKMNSTRHPQRYGRIIQCIRLLTARGAELSPSLEDEWNMCNGISSELVMPQEVPCCGSTNVEGEWDEEKCGDTMQEQPFLVGGSSVGGRPSVEDEGVDEDEDDAVYQEMFWEGDLYFNRRDI